MERARGAPAAAAGGWQEGIARGFSQMGIYIFEARKTMLQVYGHAAALPFHNLITGMSTSVVTTSAIYATYFQVYRTVGGIDNPLAGPIASLATSILKTPISNSMRVMQLGRAPNAFAAAKRIVQKRGPVGLYSGYLTSLFEDTIEWDLRTRLYEHLRQHFANEVSPATAGLLFGALSGMIAAWITTPFDTLKANMVYRDNAANYLLQSGPQAFYRGGSIRALSNGVKSAMFYVMLEAIQQHTPKTPNSPQKN